MCSRSTGYLEIPVTEVFVVFSSKSQRMSQVAHQAGAYPGFCSVKRLGVFLFPPNRDARVAGTNLYTWVEGATVRVVPYPRTQHSAPGKQLDPQMCVLTMRPLCMRPPSSCLLMPKSLCSSCSRSSVILYCLAGQV